MCNPTNEDKIDESLIVSKEINRFEKKLVELQNEIDKVRQNRKEEEEILDKLDKEFGSEIARIKKEFARIKERSYEETLEVSNKAKVDALKEVLPITDNYFRAKKVFEPINKDSGEGTIYDTYDKIFASFTKVIEEFGVTRVVSIGQPFDYNFMEAIMQQPSTEYPANIVSVEYQVGYKMGDKCIRPAMVVVSLGPGPSN
jgi:molecular chaperone GrpE